MPLNRKKLVGITVPNVPKTAYDLCVSSPLPLPYLPLRQFFFSLCRPIPYPVRIPGGAHV
jgi:hypothetical protein